MSCGECITEKYVLTFIHATFCTDTHFMHHSLASFSCILSQMQTKEVREELSQHPFNRMRGCRDIILK